MDIVHLQDVAESAVDERGRLSTHVTNADGFARPTGFVAAVILYHLAWLGRRANDGAANPIKNMERRAVAVLLRDGAVQQPD